MKKKNSITVTVVITLLLVILAAFIFVQPYLNSTPYTDNESITTYLGKAFGKYPRFITEKDLEKVEVLEITKTQEGYNLISIAFKGFIEKRDEYLKQYDEAMAQNLQTPDVPNLSKYVSSFQTDKSVDDFIALTNFKNLREVNISSELYPVSPNLEEFKNFANLKALSIIGSSKEGIQKVNDISALADKTELVTVSMPYNDISDISALKNLTNLETVMFDNNQISDISALSGKEKLKSVSFASNQISDISALAGLTLLETVTFDQNEIVDISVLKDMDTISTLSLSSNMISDISPVATLKNAYLLSLGNNLITEVAPLAAFSDVTSQMYIVLSENDDITDWSSLDVLPANIIVLGKPEEKENTEETTEEQAEETTTEDTTTETNE